MHTIETARLLLRPWQKTDVDDLYEYASHPEVGPNASWLPHPHRQHSLEVLVTLFMRQDANWAIEYKARHKVIGSISLHQDMKRTAPDSRALGYSLSHNYWGRGLMSEAAPKVISYGFETMCLELIACYHFPNNERSRRIIEKCGFSFEGVLRHCTSVGELVVQDDYCYSMTKDEYFRQKGKNSQFAQ